MRIAGVLGLSFSVVELFKTFDYDFVMETSTHKWPVENESCE